MKQLLTQWTVATLLMLALTACVHSYALSATVAFTAIYGH